MNNFEIEKLAPGVWNIEAGMGNTIYVVEGENKAMVIDTGMGEEPILPAICSLTDKPLELAITHAHGDHMGHAADFDVRYLCERDIAFADASAERLGMAELMGMTFEPVKAGDILDLGGVTLEVIPMYGHTPGSVGYYCPQHHLIFTGDAIGSGCGVWMQVPGGQNIGEYKSNLEQFVAWAKAQPQPIAFYGGHRFQHFRTPEAMESGIPDNEPDLKLVEDMIVLCDGLLKGEIKGHVEEEIPSFGQGPAMVASYGKADIVYLESRLI